MANTNSDVSNEAMLMTSYKDITAAIFTSEKLKSIDVNLRIYILLVGVRDVYSCGVLSDGSVKI